jgi:hypothetical protein
MPTLDSITESSNPKKKLMAIFTQDSGRKKTIHFGAAGYDDYTLSKGDKAAKEQRTRYRNRHDKEDWTNPMSAGALSRFILWGDSTSRATNISSFKKRFNL